MKYDEIKTRATGIISPQLDALQRGFADDVNKLRADQTLRSWEKDSRAGELAAVRVQQTLTVIADSIKTVIVTVRLRLAEQKIHLMFDELRPPIWDLKQDIFKW